MNAVTFDRADAHAGRLAAIARRNAAKAQHDLAVDGRADADGHVASAKARERATAAEVEAATMETAPRLMQAHRDADAVLIVANRNLRAAQAAEAAAEKALRDAEAAVLAAVRKIARAEWYELRDQLTRTEAEAISLRERLIAFEVAAGVLSDRELWAVSYRKTFTTEFSGVVRVPLMSMDSGHFEERASSECINAAAASWRKRLAELCEGQA